MFPPFSGTRSRRRFEEFHATAVLSRLFVVGRSVDQVRIFDCLAGSWLPPPAAECVRAVLEREHQGAGGGGAAPLLTVTG